MEERENIAKAALRYTGYTFAGCLGAAVATVTDSGIVADVLGTAIGTVGVLGTVLNTSRLDKKDLEIMISLVPKNCSVEVIR